MNQRRRRHHSIPRHHLQRWARPRDGRLYMHERGADGPRLVSPGDAAVERGLYSPGAGDDPDDDAVEILLAEHVDAPAKEIIDKLIAESPTALTMEERERFALFLTFQDVRVPAFRALTHGFLGELGKRVLQLAIQHPRGTPFEEYDDDKRARLHDAVETGAIAIEPTNVAWLGPAFIAAVDLMPLVRDLGWTVGTVPSGEELILTDRPVSKVVTDSSVPRLYAGGWVSPSAESTFPLDPTHLLILRPDFSADRTGLTSEYVRDVNDRSTSQAERFVYARRRELVINFPASGHDSDTHTE